MGNDHSLRFWLRTLWHHVLKFANHLSLIKIGNVQVTSFLILDGVGFLGKGLK